VLSRRLPWFVVLGAVALCILLALAAGSSSAARSDKPQKEDSGEVAHDVSPPLRDIAPAPTDHKKEKKEKEPKHGLPVPAQSPSDPVIQSSPGQASAPALGVGFDGVGQGFSGPQGSFTVDSAPPDPNSAVGPNRIVELVNASFAIFDKSGTAVYGPVPTNTLWSGFGGGCQSNDDGDATVAYDRIADRWVISQLSVSTTPFLLCVAVSTSPDPTGSYYRYAFSYANFPDYPKLGVWPDAYYTTFNQFNSSGTTFLGPEVCAWDRAKMLAGQAATQQCFSLSSSYGSLLPSDLDGSRLPPTGSPNYVLSFGTNVLQLWKFHVDWATSSNTTLTGPTNIPVASFSPACNGGGTCIPQPGTSNQLDSLADRLMYRLAYRNLGDHESLVVSHSVTAGSSVGVRWYELRSPNTTPTVYQQGTYAPDSAYRWMGSIAMDQNGDIALGYSVSSSSIGPSIRYTGRLSGDTLGQMTQGEGTIVNGSGSQNGGLSRWGDYTSMSVDPSDDCTFWYTDEYLASTGSFNWHTRIGSFKFPGCGSPPPANDFSISASPSSLTVLQGASGTSTISTAVTNGSAQSVSLSVSGAPSGTTVSFSPASVTAGGSSTMTVAVGAATPIGSYPMTVTGTGTGATHSTSVALTVTGTGGVANGGFETGTLSGWSAGGSLTPVVTGTPHAGTHSARLGSSSAFDGDSTLTQTLTVPSGSPTLTFWYQPHCTDSITYDQIQMQLRSTSGAILATVLNVCSNTGAWTQVSYNLAPYAGQNVVLWFNDHDDNYPSDPTYFLLDDVAVSGTAPPASDFSISASPSSLTVLQGASGTSTISTAVTSGSAQSVSLSASGTPSGTTVSFSPASVTAGASSTMTVAVGTATPAGTYTITVTGTGSTATHTTAVALTVTTPGGTGVTNGGFETGTLGGWSTSGAFAPVVVTSQHHAGRYSAQLGSTAAFDGDSTLTQTVVVPTGHPHLTFFYQPHCNDTIDYDQIQMQVRSTTGATLKTVLNVCSKSNTWKSVSVDLTAYAGQTIVLWFNDHDDGYAGDPTWFFLDDVAIA
jgi:hypothetical protein